LIVAAIDAGRAIIVPASQRATALRFAWARVQQARGLAVWKTPGILTWEAWLARQWRSATLTHHKPDARQLLNLSQERLLWELALQQLGVRREDPESLRPHAAALMRAASLATQSLLPLARMAATDEELLLVAALQEVRRLCSARGLLSLQLASPEELGFLAGCEPPVIVGQPQLTALQQRLQQLHWPDAQLLPAPAVASVATPALRRTAHLDAEMTACAKWCREQLRFDGSRRLLVVSCWQDPGANTQAALLWRALAGNGGAPDEQRQTLLAVEGGEQLHHQVLVADALAGLAATAEWVGTDLLWQLLRSPYFHFGTASECNALQSRLGMWGLAGWRHADLREALASVASKLPAASRMLIWLEQARTLRAQLTRRSATGWAECFSQCLSAAGFASGHALDSRDAQRLLRWGELLDEFAGLDAALLPMDADSALQALRRLAQQSIHQVATGDAAITLTTQQHDPVVHYDGIWVMGLTENRWPAPPRPDPYVPLHEQRRCGWPQAGVAQRLQSAQWLQERWQLRTDNLVLSYARQEGDVRHRPSALLARFAAPWEEAEVSAGTPLASTAAAGRDPQLPPMSSEELALPLRGGVERLRVQQECAFHAQAQWRLGAEAPATLTDGIPSRLRGILLHSLLEGLWGELQDQQHLLALTPVAQAELVQRHWSAALRDNATAVVAWLAPGVLERERLRTARLLERVLELERERAAFSVRLREHEVVWRNDAAALVMRIDRIDQTAAGQHLLVDYKSGEAGSIRLHKGEARPLQLAAYVVALADAGLAAEAALLLGLSPADASYAGASAIEEPLPGRVKQVEDWPLLQQQWQRELRQLLTEHLSGAAPLAATIAACRYCHLPAFCRRRAIGDALPEEEEGSDE
jgi:probable DNA repair protein